MQYRRLGKTELQVSALGYGASALGGVFEPIDESQGIRSVHTALDLGVNFIDVAPYYGRTKAETVLGRALHGIDPDRYILATKVGRYGVDEFDFSAARVKSSINESLQRLGVDHIDLIQCHDIEFGDLRQIVEETLPALERARREGKARFVGITGLPLKIFDEVLKHSTVDTILSYCRYTLWDTSLARLIPKLQELDLGVINAAPLGMGLLTPGGPASWHPAPDSLKSACGEAAGFCEAHGADVAALALQFAASNSDIATTVVSSADPGQVAHNVRCLEKPMDRELLSKIMEILQPVRNITWPSGKPKNNDA